jgi:2-polyprenyl-6-methoxyphenol hydroxylase-like FAD-dependent oxidoreductase
MNRLIVVGAGPAGLSLALQLARAGQAVTLLEARRDFSRSLRGDALMPCGQEALARMGLLHSLEALPQRPLQDWQIWLEGRQLFAVAEPLGALRPCQLVPQQALLEALLAQAMALPAFQWQPGVGVSGLHHHGGRVRGVQLSDGGALEADLVIACDGRDSSLRQAAGLKLHTRGQALELLWFQLPGAAGPPEGFLTLVGGGAIASACRGARGDLQLGWVLRHGEAIPQRTPEAWAEAIANLAPPELAALLRQQGAALSGPQRLRVQMGMARRWQRPGLLLLGDAAHPMSPIRAQGINMALRDSLVAARELLRSLQCCEGLGQQLDEACLSIEALRRPEIARLQGLQLAEARQGHWIGHNALLRHGLALAAPVLGPVAQAVWTARQKPLREGAVWL